MACKLQTAAALYFLLMPDFADAKSGAWRMLFNGKDLFGREPRAGKADYKAENGTIVGTTVINSGNSFLAIKEAYRDLCWSWMPKFKVPKVIPASSSEVILTPKATAAKFTAGR